MKTVTTAGILFWTDENTLVLQRRDAKAPTSANKLGLFGGHFREDEEPIDAIIREIHEETTVPLDEISYQFIDAIATPPAPGHDVANVCYVFSAKIKDWHFKVFEGKGAEAHDINELLARGDVGRDTRHVLEKLKERKLWH